MTEQSCPRCGEPLVPVLYGYPSHEAFEAAERGELVLGGCMVRPGAAPRACAACRRAAEELR